MLVRSWEPARSVASDEPRYAFTRFFPDHKSFWESLAPTQRGHLYSTELLQSVGVRRDTIQRWRQGKGTITDKQLAHVRWMVRNKDDLRAISRMSRGARRSEGKIIRGLQFIIREARRRPQPTFGTQASIDQNKAIVDNFIRMGVDPHDPRTYIIRPGAFIASRAA